jgi:hypothetical protein
VLKQNGAGSSVAAAAADAEASAAAVRQAYKSGKLAFGFSAGGLLFPVSSKCSPSRCKLAKWYTSNMVHQPLHQSLLPKAALQTSSHQLLVLRCHQQPLSTVALVDLWMLGQLCLQCCICVLSQTSST